MNEPKVLYYNYKYIFSRVSELITLILLPYFIKFLNLIKKVAKLFSKTIIGLVVIGVLIVIGTKNMLRG